MKGYITQLEEWVYPDTEVAEIKDLQEVKVPRNGIKGIQLILEVEDQSAKVILEESEAVQGELFYMIDVPVEHNTEDSTAQDGNFVIEKALAVKPDYCSRLAPFRVYDCLKPVGYGDELEVKNNRLPIYVCFKPGHDAKAGTYEMRISIESTTGTEELSFRIHVLDTVIPSESLSITNWFSIDNMATYHNAEYGSPEHLRMIRKYAKVMRRARQTHFFMPFNPELATVDTAKRIYDFSYMKPMIDIFFEEGFKTMEVGNFAIQYDDLFTDELKSVFDKSVKISSDEGYWITSAVIMAWKRFLIDNNWEDKIIYHICDEPDVHCKDEMSVLKRKEQYFKIVNILHKHLPNAKVIEAIKSDRFKAGINIFVPITEALETYITDHKEAYDRLLDEGNEMWTYVCCAPSGHYLNRFLDIPLLASRLIFWGCSKYRLSGYLHWGLNQFVGGFNPFDQSCCPNDTGYGTSFPAGDGHMVYPLGDEVCISMRLEAQRQGAEDYELLKQLREVDESQYDQLMAMNFRTFKDYNSDIQQFDSVHDSLLTYMAAADQEDCNE